MVGGQIVMRCASRQNSDGGSCPSEKVEGRDSKANVQSGNSSDDWKQGD